MTDQKPAQIASERFTHTVLPSTEQRSAHGQAGHPNDGPGATAWLPIPAELIALATSWDTVFGGLLCLPANTVSGAMHAAWADLTAMLEPTHTTGGRHRAEDITNDLTVENVDRYRAYCANVARTRYTGHLGTAGRHARKDHQ
ncbi:hypothetical protein [Mycolicibacterium goodii]|uniref:hypothetical protein n=1 Tax=Mycolicibacterium goodii TaxID=134601 RepID=UPI001BDCA93D|nr:hypothetical protein [Mycolicibacterium goodii]MBU8830857.1 hypothetical protein [Mycolicibacterium goodii]